MVRYVVRVETELQSPAPFFTRESPPDVFSISNTVHILADLHPDASSQAQRVPAMEGQDPGRGDGHCEMLLPFTPGQCHPLSFSLPPPPRDNCYLGTELEVLRATRCANGMESLVSMLGGLQCISKVTDLREQLMTSYNHEARRGQGTQGLCARN